MKYATLKKPVASKVVSVGAALFLAGCGGAGGGFSSLGELGGQGSVARQTGSSSWALNGVEVSLVPNGCGVNNQEGLAVYIHSGRAAGSVVIQRGAVKFTTYADGNITLDRNGAPTPLPNDQRGAEARTGLMRIRASTIQFCNTTMELFRRGALPGQTGPAPLPGTMPTTGMRPQLLIP